MAEERAAEWPAGSDEAGGARARMAEAAVSSSCAGISTATAAECISSSLRRCWLPFDFARFKACCVALHPSQRW